MRLALFFIALAIGNVAKNDFSDMAGGVVVAAMLFLAMDIYELMKN